MGLLRIQKRPQMPVHISLITQRPELEESAVMWVRHVEQACVQARVVVVDLEDRTSGLDGGVPSDAVENGVG